MGYLQSGFAKTVIEELHVALLFLKFLLQLCNAGFQAAFLVKQGRSTEKDVTEDHYKLKPRTSDEQAQAPQHLETQNSYTAQCLL